MGQQFIPRCLGLFGFVSFYTKHFILVEFISLLFFFMTEPTYLILFEALLTVSTFFRVDDCLIEKETRFGFLSSISTRLTTM